MSGKAGNMVSIDNATSDMVSAISTTNSMRGRCSVMGVGALVTVAASLETPWAARQAGGPRLQN
jgi:hypothetical protein